MGDIINGELQINIDLRAVAPEARDQGTRPLCLAFAASDTNTILNEIGTELSVEYLAFYAYKIDGCSNFDEGLTLNGVSKALVHHGQPLEDQFPYNQERIEPLEPTMHFENFFFSELFEFQNQIACVERAISASEPSIIVVNLPDSFFNPQPPWIFDKETGNSGIHALVVVGMGQIENGRTCFLVRNSWGELWGMKGHAWVTKSFLEEHLLGILTPENIYEIDKW